MDDGPGVMRLSEPAQLKALGHKVRQQVVSLLLERDATVSQLADALGIPVGTVGHHLRVLEDAGLVEIARTREVRGIVEKHYRRTARLFLLDHEPPEGAAFAAGILDEARAEVVTDLEADLAPHAAIAYARVSSERAEDFYGRLCALVDEFRVTPAESPHTWGLVVGVFPTTRRPLPPDDEAEAATDTDERDTEGA